MAKRPCLDCGDLAAGSRCSKCEAERERNRKPRPTNTTRTSSERTRRAAAVRAHVHRYGYWCPGWQRPAHATPDLTADHITPIAAGGQPDGELQVLCRSCNGRKAARTGGGRGEGGTPPTERR